MNHRKWKQNLDMTRDGKYVEKGTSGEKENDSMKKKRVPQLVWGDDRKFLFSSSDLPSTGNGIQMTSKL